MIYRLDHSCIQPDRRVGGLSSCCLTGKSRKFLQARLWPCHVFCFSFLLAAPVYFLLFAWLSRAKSKNPFRLSPRFWTQDLVTALEALGTETETESLRLPQSESSRWAWARWAWDFLKQIGKKYQWNLVRFQTHQQVSQSLQFQYHMHREAVQFVFFCN